MSRPARKFSWKASGALAAALALGRAASGGVTVSVVTLPAAILADNATEAAVYCAIVGGFPNNIYGVKGTFSSGVEPYYGLTYVSSTTMWAAQTSSWNAQLKVQTDEHGTWQGFLFVRLEPTAPRGDVVFRCSAIPLSPIEHASANVSEWSPTRALEPSPDGEAGWLCGHVFLDPECTLPASSVVVRATDSSGRVLAAYVSQKSFIVDGENSKDAGFVRLGLPVGAVASLSGRTRATKDGVPGNSPVTLYVKQAGPWTIRPGSVTSLDEREDSVWGDADGDGAFTWNDVQITAQLAAGVTGPEAEACRRADVWPDPPDGCVTTGDVVRLLRRLSGL